MERLGCSSEKAFLKRVASKQLGREESGIEKRASIAWQGSCSCGTASSERSGGNAG